MNRLKSDTKKCSLDAINTERRGNQLVLYTAEHGQKTGTNGLGIEAVIENGIVIAKGENDYAIPTDGMVLSGIGLAKDWIDECVEIGASVAFHEDDNIIELL